MDGAFFRRDILDRLERAGAEYAIKVPFHPWLGLKARVLQTRTWTRVTDDVTCAEHTVEVACWQRRCRMVLYRRHVEHETAKNFQLDLFDPNDGHYEYSAVVTNKPIDGRALWAFMCGRGVHEKVYGELKSGLGFGSRPLDALRCQQRVAVTQRAGVQSQPELPARHDGPAPRGVPQTAGALPLRDDSHAPRPLPPARRAPRASSRTRNARCRPGGRHQGAFQPTGPPLGRVIFCHIKANSWHGELVGGHWQLTC